ncbi:hypothetical protein CBR_g27776 [Chara braunii]|uniref:Uncharacterized protein n=1 Tax=Chara braunii TaxID=69332 RepID=A0A388L8A7_CHABU|nr:hypothetical protein CBR_g27776 [Chara braunii]|eukprot:GBG78550.1 hypothetical protein CBR_g27776 [Chara braunii]
MHRRGCSMSTGSTRALQRTQGMAPGANADKTVVDDIEKDLRPPPAPDREVRGAKDDIEGGMKDGEAITSVTPSSTGSSSAAKSGKPKQASIRRWTENIAQKRLDMQWGGALFRSGAPFNFVRVDESWTLHDLYMELAAAKAKVDVPTFDTLRTVILDVVYEEAPSPNDDPVLPDPLVEDEEESRRLSNLRKTLKGRIPVGGGSDDSDTKSSDEELIWSGKPHERRTPLPRSAKGKAVMDIEKEEEEEDEYLDEEDCDPDFTVVPPSYDNENEDDVACEESFNVPDAHLDRMDSDVECWSEELQRHAVDTGSHDEVGRAVAKTMADRDQNLVKQRIQEEDARRATAPLCSRPLMPQPPPGMRGDIQERVQKHSKPPADQ